MNGMMITIRARASIWRPSTPAERAAWSASPAADGLDSAGEFKLPPMYMIGLAPSEPVKVIRSRVTAPSSGGARLDCMLVEIADGLHWYVRRSDVPGM